MRLKLYARLFSLSCALAALPLTGCIDVNSGPSEAGFPPSAQQKIVAAADWQAIASDMWKEISGRMQAAGFSENAVGFEPPAEKTQFTKAFNNFLYSEIINSGVGIAPNSDFTVTYSVQVVGYGAGNAGAGDTGDVFTDNDAPSDGNTEVILTFSLTDQNSVRLRESKIYYVNDSDAKLYEQSSGGTSVSTSSVVTSNWYADNPHDADKMARAETSQFSVMIDQHNGPVYDINGATVTASEHCQSVGETHAKFLSEGYPTNDRSVIKATFQCQ